MPSYKLTYFDCRYMFEMVRLMFAATDTEFEEDRLDMEYKQFKELKSTGKLPLGQVPILEVDGRLMIQSRAIQRYVAREVGMYGSNNLECSIIDEVTETFDELLADAAPWLYREKDPEKKAELEKEYLEEKGPRRLKYLEKKLESSGTGFFVGSKMTLADLAVFNILDILNDRMPAVIANYPALLALKAKVESDEKIAKYLSARPKTSM
nr:S-crystallin SL11-like isoform X1 [Lytechinus pictus]